MSTINADDGVISGSGGLKELSDATGNLALQTNGANAITINATQNVTFANSATYTGAATFSNNVTISGRANVTGATILSNTLAVTSATTLSNTLSVTGATTLTGATAFGNAVREKITVTATAAGANVNFDASTQGILYYTANATANTTINIRGSSTVPLNNVMSTGESLSCVFMDTQGATPYYVSGYQIDGSVTVPKWQGGSAPTSGNANSTDIYVFTVIKTANATFTVLGSQTQFK